MSVVEDVARADVRGAGREPRVIRGEVVELDAEDGCARDLPRGEESPRAAGRIEDGERRRTFGRDEGLKDVEEEIGEPDGREVLRVLALIELPEAEGVICLAARVRGAGGHVDRSHEYVLLSLVRGCCGGERVRRGTAAGGDR